MLIPSLFHFSRYFSCFSGSTPYSRLPSHRSRPRQPIVLRSEQSDTTISVVFERWITMAIPVKSIQLHPNLSNLNPTSPTSTKLHQFQLNLAYPRFHTHTSPIRYPARSLIPYPEPSPTRDCPVFRCSHTEQLSWRSFSLQLSTERLTKQMRILTFECLVRRDCRSINFCAPLLEQPSSTERLIQSIRVKIQDADSMKQRKLWCCFTELRSKNPARTIRLV